MENTPEPTLVELIRYNNWANQQVLAACQSLSESQLAAAMPGAYGSIRDTLQHILRSETGYIGRLTGTRPQPPFQWDAPPSVAELAAFAVQVGAAWLDTVQHIAPNAPVVEPADDGKWNRYEARVLYLQLINHGIEHRTNITTILANQAPPAPEVDGWSYWWSHRDHFATELGLDSPN